MLSLKNSKKTPKNVLHILLGLIIYIAATYFAHAFVQLSRTAPVQSVQMIFGSAIDINELVSAFALLFAALFGGVCTLFYYKKVFGFKIAYGIFNFAIGDKVNVIFIPLFIIIGYFSSFLTYFSKNILNMFFHIQKVEQPSLPTGHFAMLLTFLALCCAPAVLEELIFRAVIQNILAQKKPFSAMAVTSLLFCFMHADISEMPALFLLSFMLCYVYYKTKSIFLCVLMHFSNNLIAFLQMIS